MNRFLDHAYPLVVGLNALAWAAVAVLEAYRPGWVSGMVNLGVVWALGVVSVGLAGWASRLAENSDRK